MERRLVRLREQIDAERKQRQARLAQAPTAGKLWTSSTSARTHGTRHLTGLGNTSMPSSGQRDRGPSYRSPSMRRDGKPARPACGPGQGGSEAVQAASPRSPPLLPPLPQHQLDRLSSPSSPGAALRMAPPQLTPEIGTAGDSTNAAEYPALQRRQSSLAELGSMRAELDAFPERKPPQRALGGASSSGCANIEPQIAPEQQRQPGSLAQGSFDEAASQESFQAAVAAWRSGGEAGGAGMGPARCSAHAVEVASCSTGTAAVEGATKPRLSLFQQISMRRSAAEAGSAAARASRCAQDPAAQRVTQLLEAQQSAGLTTHVGTASALSRASTPDSHSASVGEEGPVRPGLETPPRAETASDGAAQLAVQDLGMDLGDAIAASVVDDGVTVLAIDTADPCQALTSRARLPDAILLP